MNEERWEKGGKDRARNPDMSRSSLRMKLQKKKPVTVAD